MNIPLNIDWQQILLHLLNFAILAGGLYILLYKPVQNFMKQREEHYQEMEQQAAKKLADADALQEHYTRCLADADERIRQKQEEAQQEISASRDRQLAQARTEADKIISDARASSRREREKMIASTKQELMDTAMAAARKLLLSQDELYDQFLDTAEKGEFHAEP